MKPSAQGSTDCAQDVVHVQVDGIRFLNAFTVQQEGLCLTLCPITVKRHHNQGNLYEGQHFNGAALQ